MKLLSIQVVLAVLLCCLAVGQAVQVPPFEEATQPFTNADLIEMLKGGLTENVIKAKIATSECEFDTTAAALNELKAAGASEELILLVLKTANPSVDIQSAQPAQTPVETPPPGPAPTTATPTTTTPPAEPTQGQPRSEPPPYEPRQVYTDYDETPKVEVFGGFSYARGDLDQNMFGWHFALGGVLTNWFSLVGDFSGNYWGESDEFVSVDASMYSFAGGPRFTGRSDAVTGFGHFLVGVSRIGIGIGLLGDSTSNLEFVSGGGLDINVGDHLAIRVVQGDWIHIRGNGGSANMGRISAGLVGRF